MCECSYPTPGAIPIASWKLRRRAPWACTGHLINVHNKEEIRLTVSPHSLVNRFSIKSALMGSRKAHSAFTARLEGKPATTMSIWVFSLENRLIPRTRGRARTRAARDFLKAILAVFELETNAAFQSDRCIFFYTFSVIYLAAHRIRSTRWGSSVPPPHVSVFSSGLPVTAAPGGRNRCVLRFFCMPVMICEDILNPMQRHILCYEILLDFLDPNYGSVFEGGWDKKKLDRTWSRACVQIGVSMIPESNTTATV